MTIPNRPERMSDDTPASDSGAFDTDPSDTDTFGSDNDPGRLNGSIWISLGLSVAFYLLMLAIGAKYNSDHPVHARPAEPDRSAPASPLAYATVPAPVATQTSTALIDDPDILFARAQACAAAAHWDCVIEATSGIVAQHGDTPETRALLAQAMLKGGWIARETSATTLEGKARYVRPVSTMPAGTMQATKHGHRHSVRVTPLRYAAASRPTYPGDFGDIYRH